MKQPKYNIQHLIVALANNYIPFETREVNDGYFVYCKNKSIVSTGDDTFVVYDGLIDAPLILNKMLLETPYPHDVIDYLSKNDDTTITIDSSYIDRMRDQLIGRLMATQSHYEVYDVTDLPQHEADDYMAEAVYRLGYNELFRLFFEYVVRD